MRVLPAPSPEARGSAALPARPRRGAPAPSRARRRASLRGSRRVGLSGPASIREPAARPPRGRQASPTLPGRWGPPSLLARLEDAKRKKSTPKHFSCKATVSNSGTDMQSSQFILAFRECKQIRWISFLSVEQGKESRELGDFIHMTYTRSDRRVSHTRYLP